jgi:hypothetical protein
MNPIPLPILLLSLFGAISLASLVGFLVWMFFEHRAFQREMWKNGVDFEDPEVLPPPPPTAEEKATAIERVEAAINEEAMRRMNGL